MDFDTYVRSHITIDANRFGLRFDQSLEKYLKKLEQVNRKYGKLRESQTNENVNSIE